MGCKGAKETHQTKRIRVFEGEAVRYSHAHPHPHAPRPLELSHKEKGRMQRKGAKSKFKQEKGAEKFKDKKSYVSVSVWFMLHMQVKHIQNELS